VKPWLLELMAGQLSIGGGDLIVELPWWSELEMVLWPVLLVCWFARDGGDGMEVRMIGGEFVFVFGIEQREATVEARVCE
jgi:hypothetical protein